MIYYFPVYKVSWRRCGQIISRQFKIMLSSAHTAFRRRSSSGTLSGELFCVTWIWKYMTLYVPMVWWVIQRQDRRVELHRCMFLTVQDVFTWRYICHTGHFVQVTVYEVAVPASVINEDYGTRTRRNSCWSGQHSSKVCARCHWLSNSVRVAGEIPP